MVRNSSVLILFLLGLFSETHVRVIGSIGIAELFMFLTAPIFFCKDLPLLRRHGFMPMLNLALMAMVGCVISSYHNDTHFAAMIRGLASAYALFALPVVFHHFFKDDLWSGEGFKWYCIGAAISAIITIFGLQAGVETSFAERHGGDIASAELYFSRHFGALFSLPLYAFYQRFPTWLAALIYFIPTIYTVATTATGRSSLLLVGVSLFMLFYAKRNVTRMRLLHKRVFLVFMVLLVSVPLVMHGYKYAALHGYLNEKAQKKYEAQNKSGNNSALDLLKHGRSEFFIGIMAATENPFWGYGPWPVDKENIYESYLLKYGDDDAVHEYYKSLLYFAKKGIDVVRIIPTHSFIVGNWVFYGLLGLPFWLYILYKMVQLFKYLWTVPPWFGFFAVNIPGFIWAIFFSPFSGRNGITLLITLMLLAIAAGRGQVRGYSPGFGGR